jgi:DUF971 family protein
MTAVIDAPLHLDLKKDEGLTVQWRDGRTDFFPIAFLRRMSPSAEAKHLREEMARNPLTVLPSARGGGSGEHGGGAQAGPLAAVDAEIVGNYAIRIRFSDGHNTGLYSWVYLRQLAAGR